MGMRMRSWAALKLLSLMKPLRESGLGALAALMQQRPFPSDWTGRPLVVKQLMKKRKTGGLPRSLASELPAVVDAIDPSEGEVSGAVRHEIVGVVEEKTREVGGGGAGRGVAVEDEAGADFVAFAEEACDLASVVVTGSVVPGMCPRRKPRAFP
jgi:hypothetical protein